MRARGPTMNTVGASASSASVYMFVRLCKYIMLCYAYEYCAYSILCQNAGRIHSVRIDNSTFESVEEFKYLGTTLTNQNSIVEEIMSRLRSGNACYHSVQNFCLPGCYPKI